MKKNYILLLALFITFALAQSTVDFAATIRDFKAWCTAGTASGCHIDFENRCYDVEKGLVKTTLGSDSKPVPTFTGTSSTSRSINDANSFNQWYRDVPNININIPVNLTLTKNGNTLSYNNQAFFPINGKGFGDYTNGLNFHFTVEIHSKFTYQGGETFNLQGDDDIWLFINNQLVVDLGGCHVPTSASVTLDNLGLTKGTKYNFDLFFAERHTPGSTFKFDTAILLETPILDTTKDTDGDGIPDIRDNCPNKANPSQRDCNENGIGDDCDTVQGPIDFPFVVQASKNINQNVTSTDPAATYTLENLPSTGINFQFTDGIPANSIHDQVVNAFVIIKSTDANNCLVSLQFNGKTETAKTVLVIRNSVFSYARAWSLVSTWYSYKFTPYTGAQAGTGANNLVITPIAQPGFPACTTLQVGSIVVSTRYTLTQTTATNQYHSECLGNSSCLYGTYVFGGYCACWSGAWGRQCHMDTAVPGQTVTNAWGGSDIKEAYPYDLDTSNAVRSFFTNFTSHPTCPNLNQWEVVKNLSTSAPPSLDKAGFDNQVFYAVVSQPFTNGRGDGCAFLNLPTSNRTYPDCTYPKSNFITKAVQGCKDLWLFNIPWTTAEKCDWKITTEEGYKVYRGQIVIHNHEYIFNIQDWRFLQAVLRIKVRFQRFVAVEMPTNATVFNQPNLNAAITKQIVAINLGDPALVELTTLLPYPYTLTAGDLTRSPTGKVATYNYTQGTCTSVQGQSCKQRWRASLKLTDDTCTLTGDYRMNWTKACGIANPTAQNCPLTDIDKPAGVDFSLTSENFCAEITVEVGLTGTLTSYEDAAFTTARTAYIVGKTAYFKVVINSELNTSPYNAATAVVKFSNTKLITVTIRPEGASPVRVWEKGARATFAAGEDPQVNLVEVDLVAGNEVGFNFIFTSQLAALLQPNNIQKFTIGAEVQCSYQNTAKKRDSLQADQSENSAYSTEATIDNTTPNPNPTPATASAYHIIASFAILIIVLLF